MVGTQTAIIGASEPLKCKLLSGIFKDAALRWYMNLPNYSITGYMDFHRKLIHQFQGSKHMKVTVVSLFSIRQENAESLREFLARLSEDTIKVENPNQEMFMATFQNGLKAGHFNESLAQKPAVSMEEIMKRAECYMESNAEKRSRDAKEKGHESKEARTPERHRGRCCDRNSRLYMSPKALRDERHGRTYETYTPLNTRRVHVLQHILQTVGTRLVLQLLPQEF
ncbi:gag-pol polyprotein [Trifolium medium]|uniref:Gag-pol polyprotein n=1 Tax=Trifolium medium TaxID=97028 RepID=A0A392M4Q8_9FABA|nr:gag-pol polyprotein [Trifolium medium]